jgi:hypothetical protein
LFTHFQCATRELAASIAEQLHGIFDEFHNAHSIEEDRSFRSSAAMREWACKKACDWSPGGGFKQVDLLDDDNVRQNERGCVALWLEGITCSFSCMWAWRAASEGQPTGACRAGASDIVGSS